MLALALSPLLVFAALPVGLTISTTLSPPLTVPLTLAPTLSLVPLSAPTLLSLYIALAAVTVVAAPIPLAMPRPVGAS